MKKPKPVASPNHAEKDTATMTIAQHILFNLVYAIFALTIIYIYSRIININLDEGLARLGVPALISLIFFYNSYKKIFLAKHDSQKKPHRNLGRKNEGECPEGYSESP